IGRAGVRAPTAGAQVAALRCVRNNGAVIRTRVLLLGSTGSIGTQALEVIAAAPERFEVVGLAAGGGNVELLAEQARTAGVREVAVADAAAAPRVSELLGFPVRSGPRSVEDLVRDVEADVVLNGLVGSLGLR